MPCLSARSNTLSSTSLNFLHLWNYNSRCIRIGHHKRTLCPNKRFLVFMPIVREKRNHICHAVKSILFLQQNDKRTFYYLWSFSYLCYNGCKVFCSNIIAWNIRNSKLKFTTVWNYYSLVNCEFSVLKYICWDLEKCLFYCLYLDYSTNVWKRSTVLKINTFHTAILLIKSKMLTQFYQTYLWFTSKFLNAE